MADAAIVALLDAALISVFYLCDRWEGGNRLGTFFWVGLAIFELIPLSMLVFLYRLSQI